MTATTTGRGIIERYRSYLPVTPATPIVSLGEGDTPLLPSERLSARVDAEVWLKYEGLNPTGSFKDRGMTLAISKVVEEGVGAVLCASTGNTSASAAAYAARAGIVCGVLVPKGHVARGKLAQALVHGARVLEVDANFDTALALTKQVVESRPVRLVNSTNPLRIEGQKTAAFEVVEALGRAPDIHVMPVGNAGNITSYWRGYREAMSSGWSDGLPRMHGFQAEGADPIVRGEVIADPQTQASAIRIDAPASWTGALQAAGESGGAIGSVSDDEMIEMRASLAAEGIFVELASAVGVAGLLRLSDAGRVSPGALVVCVLTGHGLKDADGVLPHVQGPRPVAADVAAVTEALGLA
ncbi:MAG: threonine synthase [Actinomycetota bacterium]